MRTRNLVAVLSVLIIAGSGTAFASGQGAHRPDFRRPPAQRPAAATQHRPAVDRQANTYRQQHQDQHQQHGPAPADPIAKSGGKASPVAGAATANAGQGETTAEKVHEAIQAETGQEVPGTPDEPGTEAQAAEMTGETPETP